MTGNNSSFEKLPIGVDATEVRLSNPDKQTIFYQLLQAGFDNTPNPPAIKQGIEIFREYRSSDKQVISSTTLGAEIEVRIQVRALDNQYLSNIAIMDLLPGGFEVVRDSVNSETVAYADVREDRVIFFTSLNPEAKEIVYRIKGISTGQFTVPAIFAESMYNNNVKARGDAATITVNPVDTTK